MVKTAVREREEWRLRSNRQNVDNFVGRWLGRRERHVKFTVKIFNEDNESF